MEKQLKTKKQLRDRIDELKRYKADGYPEVAITICLVAPTEEIEQNDLDQTDSEQSE